jgi:LysM repeat protein
VNSLKPLILLAVLFGVGFGVYRSLNKRLVDVPEGIDTSGTGPLEIKLGDAGARGDAAEISKSAPPVVMTPKTGNAPPFNSQSAEPPAHAHTHSGQPADAHGAEPHVHSAQPHAHIAQPHAHAEVESPLSSKNEPKLSGYGAAAPAPGAAYGTPESSRSAPTTQAATFGAAWTTIQPKLVGGKLSDALEDLTAWHNHPSLTPTEQAFVQRLLGELAGTVIYSNEHLMAAPYRVQAGERLADVAEKHQISAELLAKINGIDPQSVLRPGDAIKVVKGPFSAIVDVAAGQLTLMVDGRYAGSFSLAGLGSSLSTKMRAGERVELTVSQKTVAPIYNGPQGEIDAGKPNNPLGQHLVALGSELALHGTNPQAARADQPAGGIRMNPADIAEVYDILTVGSRVVVRK